MNEVETLKKAKEEAERSYQVLEAEHKQMIDDFKRRKKEAKDRLERLKKALQVLLVEDKRSRRNGK